MTHTTRHDLGENFLRGKFSKDGKQRSSECERDKDKIKGGENVNKEHAS